MAEDYKGYFTKFHDFSSPAGRRHRSRIFSYLITLIPKTYWCRCLAVRAANNPKAMGCNEHECLSRAGPMARKPATASRNLVEFDQRRGSNRIRPFPRAVAPAASARRRCSGRDWNSHLRPPSGPAGGRWRARQKRELLKRVWPSVVVSEENLKVHVSALRKALGADRDLIRTEFGRGYRFIGILRSNASPYACRDPRARAKLCSVELCFYRTAGNRSSVVSVRSGSRN